MSAAGVSVKATGGPQSVGPRVRIVMPIVYTASFILQDVASLSLRHDVRPVPCRQPAEMLGALAAVARADLVLCWFGSLRFLPLIVMAKLQRIPVAVVSGGYDVANEPEIDYGNMRGGLTRRLGRLLFRLVDLCLPYSCAGRRETVEHAGVLEGRQRLIPLGFDPTAFDVPGGTKKLPVVVTVGRITPSSIKRKGIITVARMSHALTDVRIVIAGQAEPSALAELRAAAAPHVEFPGYLTDSALRALLADAAVYIQPSIHEAFGCAVAEAMLQGCIPVTTRAGSLPEIVGECGVYVPASDPAAAAAGVREALVRSRVPGAAVASRERIVRLFPLERRRALLYGVIDELCAR